MDNNKEAFSLSRKLFETFMPESGTYLVHGDTCIEVSRPNILRSCAVSGIPIITGYLNNGTLYIHPLKCQSNETE